MRDRRFWTLALGVFPLALVGLAFVQFLRVPWVLRGPALVALLVLEGVVLWRAADEGDPIGDAARGRRVAFGLVLSLLSAAVWGGAALAAVLVLTLGPDG